ncbi:O-methyltransferase [Aliifodinibius salicampi]|uniref:O-methyltransferase n=1 Tax=Fodinibius salicampi TaxID=1920655 RepID=A0ABT3PWY4_9BACT|nr:O-methyltransferase [Fodinibius salicampi]MCW9712359.1 O-methyltransferase [Fodinibius salicampi]
MVSKEIEDYAISHTSKEDPLIQELLEVANQKLEHTDMISGRLVGRLLAFLVELSGADRILEVGTFVGYSALTMAKVMPKEGVLFSCEYNEHYEAIARHFFEKSEYSSKIHLVMGKALETIPAIPGNFDFIFLDADKINYPRYYDLLLPRLNKDGLMVVDNTLWGGEVIDPQSEKSQVIASLNKTIKEDESVEQLLLPVRDGLTLIKKK